MYVYVHTHTQEKWKIHPTRKKQELAQKTLVGQVTHTCGAPQVVVSDLFVLPHHFGEDDDVSIHLERQSIHHDQDTHTHHGKHRLTLRQTNSH